MLPPALPPSRQTCWLPEFPFDSELILCPLGKRLASQWALQWVLQVVEGTKREHRGAQVSFGFLLNLAWLWIIFPAVSP